MKRKFKGFTLVECIVAIAILGVASLVMAQIYAAVSRNNKMNHLVNTSLSNQVAFVEKYEKSNTETVPIYFGGGTTSTPDPNAADTNTAKKPPHIAYPTPDTTHPYINIVSSYKPASASSGQTYSYSVDIFVLKSRDRNDNALSATGDAGYTESDYNLRYKYISGHSN